MSGVALTGKVARATEMGYFIPGYSVLDYMRKAFSEYGFYSWFVWGPLGSGKSNWALQAAFLYYREARGVTSDDHAWELVLDRLVLGLGDLEKLINYARDRETRLPVVILDDAGVYLPSTLYHVSKIAYTKWKRLAQLMRTLFNNVITTAPRREDVVKFLSEEADFETIIKGRNGMVGTFDAQRRVPLIDYDRDKTSRTLVRVEHGRWPLAPGVDYEPAPGQRFRPPGVPYHVWRRYWDRRVDAGYEAAESLITELTTGEHRGVSDGFVKALREEIMPLLLSGETLKLWRQKGAYRVMHELDRRRRKLRMIYTCKTEAEADILRAIIYAVRDYKEHHQATT